MPDPLLRCPLGFNQALSIVAVGANPQAHSFFVSWKVTLCMSCTMDDCRQSILDSSIIDPTHLVDCLASVQMSLQILVCHLKYENELPTLLCALLQGSLNTVEAELLAVSGCAERSAAKTRGCCDGGGPD